MHVNHTFFFFMFEEELFIIVLFLEETISTMDLISTIRFICTAEVYHLLEREDF